MNELDTKDKYGAGRGTLTTYISGFLLSIGLTLVGYLMASRHVNSQNVIFSTQFLIFALASLAVIQLFVQLIFFLHLGQGSNGRWNLMVAGFAALVVLIVVYGSIWIMGNLNYHHEQALTPSQTNQQIINDEGIHVH